MSKEEICKCLDEIAQYFYECYRNAISGNKAYEKLDQWMCAIDEAKEGGAE